MVSDAASQRPTIGRGQHVLIMDDDFSLQEQWRHGLTKAGFSVTTTGSATEALAILEKKTFDVAVVDLIVRSPNNSNAQGGLRLLREVRFTTKKKLRSMSIIGVSGYRPMGQIDMAKQLMTGFHIDRFLAKPFNTAQLVDLVIEVVNAKR